MIPTGGMLVVHFSARFLMDLIGVLSILGWSNRVQSGFILWGFSGPFFLGCEIGFLSISRFCRFWLVFLGACLGGIGIGFGPSFIGGH